MSNCQTNSFNYDRNTQKKKSVHSCHTSKNIVKKINYRRRLTLFMFIMLKKNCMCVVLIKKKSINFVYFNKFRNWKKTICTCYFFLLSLSFSQLLLNCVGIIALGRWLAFFDRNWHYCILIIIITFRNDVLIICTYS